MKNLIVVGIVTVLWTQTNAIAGCTYSVPCLHPAEMQPPKKPQEESVLPRSIVPIKNETQLSRDFYLMLFVRWQLSRFEFWEQLETLSDDDQNRFQEFSQRQSTLNRRERTLFGKTVTQTAQKAFFKLKNEPNGMQEIVKRRHFVEKFRKAWELSGLERKGLRTYFEKISRDIAGIDVNHPSFEEYRVYYNIQTKKYRELAEILTWIDELPAMEEQILNWEPYRV